MLVNCDFSHDFTGWHMEGEIAEVTVIVLTASQGHGLSVSVLGASLEAWAFSEGCQVLLPAQEGSH